MSIIQQQLLDGLCNTALECFSYDLIYPDTQQEKSPSISQEKLPLILIPWEILTHVCHSISVSELRSKSGSYNHPGP